MEFVYVTTTTLRKNLSETMSRAAYGNELVVVTRRRNRVAAIVPFEDAVFLDRMKERRKELLNVPLPKDPEKVGPALAERLMRELLFL